MNWFSNLKLCMYEYSHWIEVCHKVQSIFSQLFYILPQFFHGKKIDPEDYFWKFYFVRYSQVRRCSSTSSLVFLSELRYAYTVIQIESCWPGTEYGGTWTSSFRSLFELKYLLGKRSSTGISSTRRIVSTRLSLSLFVTTSGTPSVNQTHRHSFRY